MPTPHHSVFYRPDALPAAQTNSVKALKAFSISQPSILQFYKQLQAFDL